MKYLLNEATRLLQPLGYEKLGARLFKIENGFFKQIDFQRGSHGRYFFVNVCIHPMGLPELLAGKLVIPDRPLECECIIRRRIEEIITDESTAGFRSGTGFVSYDDDQAISQLLPSLLEVQVWLAKWASFETIVNATDLELKQMITATPLLREKACAMLRYFCAFKVKSIDEARRYLEQYHAAPTRGYDFGKVDEYLSSLSKNIPSCAAQPDSAT